MVAFTTAADLYQAWRHTVGPLTPIHTHASLSNLTRSHKRFCLVLPIKLWIFFFFFLNNKKCPAVEETSRVEAGLHFPRYPQNAWVFSPERQQRGGWSGSRPDDPYLDTQMKTGANFAARVDLRRVDLAAEIKNTACRLLCSVF